VIPAESITRIHARQVLDSRGNPTVEVEVHCAGGAWGRAIVPAGASTGRHEAVELRDGDPASFGGKSVRRAVANVHERIAPRLLGLSAADQAGIDRLLCELDGTPNKAQLGANATLGVSLACAHAAAAVHRLPLWRYLMANDRQQGTEGNLPLPMVNLISGGLHAGGNLDFQDFLLIPIGAQSFSEALAMTVKVYRALSSLLIKNGLEGVLVGDEGGFSPRLPDNEQPLRMIREAIEMAGLTPGCDAAIALDVASSHFYRPDGYHLTGAIFSAEALIDLLEQWVDKYPILSIEDAMAEDDWEGWRKLTHRLGSRVQLVGDDLFATNPERLRTGIAEGVANSVLIKVNQIGTLTEARKVIRLAQSAGYRPIISARSGETEDSTIADLAVATGSGQIKIGSVARSERLAKYNQLLRIEEQMERPVFAGRRALASGEASAPR
jgi:enolase